MKAAFARALAVLARGDGDGPAPLDGFVDSLIQTFENCRVGLTPEALADPASVESFFVAIYEKELPRLRDAARLEETLLPESRRGETFDRVDTLVRTVVIPAYVRIAARFTEKERNDFYLAPEPWHGLERAGWTVLGILLGSFVVWAPFIPIWAREAILPFAVAGLLFPNIRRWLEIRRYEGEVNRLVARTDREIERVSLARMTAAGAFEDDRAASARPTFQPPAEIAVARPLDAPVDEAGDAELPPFPEAEPETATDTDTEAARRARAAAATRAGLVRPGGD